MGRHFLNLPRELRDLIYAYIVAKDTPLELTDCGISAPLDHPVISVEWLEALYAHSNCSVSFSDPRLLRDDAIQHDLFGNHSQYKSTIRHLIVNVSEAVLREDDLEKVEHECTHRKPEVRQQWNELLRLPRLESLTINMQKHGSSGFVWANFSPILYALRERLPKLRIVFNISFDKLLESEFNVYLAQSEQLRQWIPGDAADDLYQPMGFVGLSALIAPPTDEDRTYVEEYVGGSRDVGSLDIVGGLLDEVPESRRILTKHYLVKEPALLRVLMAEHYELYKLVRKEREEVETRRENSSDIDDK